MMAGSFGVTGVLDFYEQLAKKSDKIQIVVITGRNIRLFDHLDKKIQELGTSKNTKLLYFVDNVESPADLPLPRASRAICLWQSTALSPVRKPTT